MQKIRPRFAMFVLTSVCGAATSLAQAQAQAPRATVEFELASQPASVRALGTIEQASVLERWHTICTSPLALSEDELRTQALLHASQIEAARREGRVVRVNRSGPSSRGFSTRSAGLDIIFDISLESPVGDPLSAFEMAEAIIESRFTSGGEIVVPITWDTLSENVLGLASITRARISYTASRAALLAEMDSDDYVQPWLPTGSTIPVRFTWNSGTVTNVSQVDWPVANYLATVGSVAASPGSIRFASNANWDETPVDGITPGQVSLVDVIVHEVAHLMGFDSNAEVSGATTITSLDLFRFANQDRAGLGDTNPDSQADFSTTPREVDNASGGTDLVHSVVGDTRIRMSDGNVYQASHLRQVSFDPVLASGIMQPVIGEGRTFAPSFLREQDLVLLDAVGWSRVGAAPVRPAACSNDWSKDGWPDVLWRAKPTLAQGSGGSCLNDSGQIVTWSFRAGQFVGWNLRPHPVGPTTTCPATNGAPWELVLASADVDGDCDADIIWRNPQGLHVLWRLENGQVAAWSVLPAVDPAWRIVAGGDIDADGTGDLLWRNGSTNELGVWYMRDAGVLRWQSLGIQLASPWEVQGLGDVVTTSMSGGNAGADILWRNTTTGENQAFVVTSAGISRAAALPVVAGAWRIKGNGDFNGDGTTDLFWFNTANGTTGIWFLEGTTVREWRGMPGLDATRWE